MKNVLISAVLGAAAGFAACKFGPKVIEWGKEKISGLRARKSEQK